MKQKTILFLLTTLTLACYSQKDDPRTITIKLPKIAPSVCFGYVNPFREAGGTIGWGINSQINLPIGKHIYYGLNYGLQITGNQYAFKDYPKWKLHLIGGDFGFKFQLKRDLGLTIGMIINRGLFIPSDELKSWSNVYFMDMTLKYTLNNRFNFINRIQFGGGNNMLYRPYFNTENVAASYRTLNFMFGIEFN